MKERMCEATNLVQRLVSHSGEHFIYIQTFSPKNLRHSQISMRIIAHDSKSTLTFSSTNRRK